MFRFLFYQLHSKSGAANQIIHPCFRKMKTIGQLKLKAVMIEKKGYTLRKTIYIKF